MRKTPPEIGPNQLILLQISEKGIFIYFNISIFLNSEVWHEKKPKTSLLKLFLGFDGAVFAFIPKLDCWLSREK